MRILILGCNGFIGHCIGQQALLSGHTVYGVGRSQQTKAASEFIYIPGDRTDVEHIVRITREHEIDVVVDMIAMVSASTEPLLNALDGEIHQYVMISSADVYRNYELLHRRTSGAADVETVDEQSALRTRLYPYRGETPRASDAPDRYLDDYDKIPIENAVRELTCPWTILRLPMVYGPGDRQRRFRWAIGPMLAGEPTLTIPAGWANWQSTYGFIDNVGAAVAATFGNAKAYRQTFNVADAAQRTQIEWARRFAEAMRWQGNIELTDDPEHPFQKQLAALDLNVPFRVNGGRIRRLLEIPKVVSEADAMARTITSEAEANG